MKSLPKPTIIIPCAGNSSRMRTYEPKALTPVHANELLILRQIRLLSKVFPKSEICVVVGYDAEKVCAVLPKNIHVVENQLYDVTNVGKSIGLALRATCAKQALIVYGDLVFSEALISQLNTDSPSALLDPAGIIRNDEVGAVINKGYVEHFFYAHATKWCQIAFLKNKELSMFSELANDPANCRMYGFEIMNHVIERGGKIKGYSVDDLNMVEVDASKDVINAVKIR